VQMESDRSNTTEADVDQEFANRMQSDFERTGNIVIKNCIAHDPYPVTEEMLDAAFAVLSEQTGDLLTDWNISREEVAAMYRAMRIAEP
jgi:hypothetical protein